jgi:hypothetical protein
VTRFRADPRAVAVGTSSPPESIPFQAGKVVAVVVLGLLTILLLFRLGASHTVDAVSNPPSTTMFPTTVVTGFVNR